MSDLMMTTEEVAQALRLPRATILQFTHRRILNYYKLGRRNFYKKEDVENFIEARRRPALAAAK